MRFHLFGDHFIAYLCSDLVAHKGIKAACVSCLDARSAPSSFLLLIAMPFVLSGLILLVVRPGAPLVASLLLVLIEYTPKRIVSCLASTVPIPRCTSLRLYSDSGLSPSSDLGKP